MSCRGSLSESVYGSLWDLYNSTNGTHWTWSTQLPSSTIWTFPSDISTPCSNSWQGLVCSVESPNSCYVEEIVLNSYNLSGYLPSSLGEITSSKKLELAENSLIGTIPCQLGNLLSLEVLYLYSNSLVGTIPTELGNLHSLQELYLYSNSLVGTIPSELGNIHALQQLYLYFNSLSGTVPSDLGNLQSLLELYVSINFLSGAIPCELGNLQSLEALTVSSNILSGTIPCELGNLQSLQQLYLNFNSLSGTLPSDLRNLQSLELLSSCYNSLSGTIPSEWGNLLSLEELYLYSNILSGTLPSELGNLRSLQQLYLYNNSLSGSIPSELGNLQSLQELYLYYNSLVGTIPSELGNLRSLQYLLLYNNHLAGSIPGEFRNLSSMEVMLVDSNMLTGMFPIHVIGHMLNLSTLGLSENSLSGSIPNQLAQLNKTLSSLFLNSNLFTGTIPLELSNCSSLELVDLSFNHISGNIIGLVLLPKLTQTNVAVNFLSGSIPKIPFSSLLRNVDMSGNDFEGSFGFQFSKCYKLESVVLSDNSLQGTIPVYLYDLPLNLLNLSGNAFSGDLFAWRVSAPSLEVLDVSSNKLSGTLPSQLLGMPSLAALNASNNRFSGSLSGFNLTSSLLKSLDVSSNRLTGTLPSQLFELKYLQDVLLFSNCFSGSLPETLCSSTSLEYLVMNELTSNCGSAIPRLLRPILQGEVARQLMMGSIPDCVWGMSGLKSLQLSGNGLKGSIGERANATSLKSLLLSGNQLTGTIPYWIQQSSTLQHLDLSHNRLSGRLSSSLVISSTSSLFRVSTNRLSGYLPGALFSVASNLSLDVLNGNDFACSRRGVVGWGSFLTKQNLPKSDENYETYICGSSLFDSYLLLTTILIVVLATSSLVVHYTMYDLRKLLHVGLCVWKDWSVFTVLTIVVLILFVCLHSCSSLFEFNTHSEQYLWATTAAFLRGWAPVVVILLAVGAGEFTASTLYSTNETSMRGNIIPGSFQIKQGYVALAFVAVHLLNIVAVVATNSAYVYATVNGLPRDQLFVIQFFLGCFKLAWSGSAIPWFLRSSVQEINTTTNRVFMSLFSFIGGPFISTFFTASSCFLYIIRQQSTLSSVISIAQNSCMYSCENACGLMCFREETSVITNLTPIWNYSYQCSSTLLLNYIPVIIASMTVSGLILPCLVLVQFVIKDLLLKSYLIRIVPRSLMTGESFDVVRLGRFLRVKSLVNVTTMLTFGFASPLLGMLVVVDTVSWQWIWQVLVDRQRDYLSLRVNTESSDLFRFSELLDVALKERSPSSSDCLIILSFVGVFWSLFVFDMIGDVYGDLSGGLSMLVTVILGAVIWLLVKRFRGNRIFITRTITSPGIELCDDKFVANPAQEM